MFKSSIKLFLGTLVLSSYFGSCDRFQHKNKEDTTNQQQQPAPDKPSFYIAESDYAKSKYCPAEKPALPEDPTPPYRFEPNLLDEKLKSETGLVGWMHGAVHPYHQYLFTYRLEDPSDQMAFFKAQQFTLIGDSKEAWDQLKTLNRHDKVRLKGEVFKNGSVIVHLKVKSVEVLKKYDRPTENPYSFDPSEFAKLDTFKVFGQVHATVSSPELGYALVVEKGNYIFPIAVDPKHIEIAKAIYKGDIVSIDVKKISGPDRQPHFKTDANSQTGITIVDPLINCHGLQKDVEGHLVKFEKSPAINMDVYAVRIVDGNGIGRNMTFFPDADPASDEFVEIFMAVSKKAKAAWELSKQEPSIVRNFYEKKSIKVIAHGKVNVVSTEQANAQVYLKSADDLEFKVE